MNKSNYDLRGPFSKALRILLVDTNRWPVTARLAIRFCSLGCSVAAVCPMPGHPVEAVRGIQQVFPYSGSYPVLSLKKAIQEFNPDIVVPSCDRSVQHLHELHHLSKKQGKAGEKFTSLIEYSLGPAASFQPISCRYELLCAARSEGVLVPDTVRIDTFEDLNQLMDGSWVIKADGTWGGRGVRVADTLDDAKRSFLELTQAPGVVSLAKCLVLNRNRNWILQDWKRPRRAVIAQAFISGSPANCAVVCWEGKLLAGVAVEVISTQDAKGPATVVEIVPGSAMLDAAAKIAKHFHLSGFFGLDFMIDNTTGATYLIEMNPRCTPPCPLNLDYERDLVSAFVSQLTGQRPAYSCATIEENTIAYFPAAFTAQSAFPEEHAMGPIYKDVPHGEPELIHQLLHPWSERSVIGRWVDIIRRNRLWNTKQERRPLKSIPAVKM